MKAFNVSVLAVALLGLAGVAQADTASGQSYTGAIVVGGAQGNSTNHPGEAGAPAVGVSAFYNGTKVRLVVYSSKKTFLISFQQL